MTLTEKWKKGELPNNWYYVRTTNGIEKWEYIKQSHGFGYYETEWVLEVLAPVPSYEEWKSLNEILDSSLQTNKALAHRLNLCKELLKECMTMFVKMYETNTVNSVFLGLYENIKTKIDNAIGEKK